MAESEQITYHATTSQTEIQNRSQILVSGTRSARFESEKKPLSPLFLTSPFANFARGKWSNNDSKNCSEVRKSSESGFFSLSKRALLVPETQI